MENREFKNISVVMYNYRNSLGLSQCDMAKQLRYKSGQFISNIERGLCTVPYKKLKDIDPEWRQSFADAMVEDYRTRVAKYS